MKIVKLTMEHVEKGTYIIDLPTYFRGTKRMCDEQMSPYEFVKDDNLMGGYWRDEIGNCYYLLP